MPHRIISTHMPLLCILMFLLCTPRQVLAAAAAVPEEKRKEEAQIRFRKGRCLPHPQIPPPCCIQHTLIHIPLPCRAPMPICALPPWPV